MATPLDALAWREVYGRTLRRVDRGKAHAFVVAPLYDGMSYAAQEQTIEATRRSLLQAVDYGEVYYVTREMTDYLLHDIVEKHMQSRELFHLDQGDLPSRVGFVYFDGDVPIPTSYSRSGVQNLRVIAWDQFLVGDETNGRRALWMSQGPKADSEVIGKVLYTIAETPDRHPESELYGRWRPRHWIPCTYGVRMDPTMVNGRGAEMLDEHTRLGPMDEEAEYEDSQNSLRVVFRLLTAWMAFIQTEIPVLHPKPESYDKVMYKEGRPAPDVKVTILRRYAQTPPHGMAEVDWAYRWKVKEHYRWQRVGPGRSMLRRTLVREHWKGPDDKPKAEIKRITSLER